MKKVCLVLMVLALALVFVSPSFAVNCPNKCKTLCCVIKIPGTTETCGMFVPGAAVKLTGVYADNPRKGAVTLSSNSSGAWVFNIKKCLGNYEEGGLVEAIKTVSLGYPGNTVTYYGKAKVPGTSCFAAGQRVTLSKTKIEMWL